MPCGLLAQDQIDGRYCNSRYNYCLDYPAPTIQKVEESDNQDGALLSNPDMGIYLQVSGSNNITNWTAEEVLKMEKEEVEELHGKQDFKVKKLDGNRSEIRYSLEGLPQYFLVERRGDTLLFLRLWAEKPIDPGAFDRILIQVELDSEI
jgi:hypothetical protein